GHADVGQPLAGLLVLLGAEPVAADHPDVVADLLPRQGLVLRGLGDGEIHAADRPAELQPLPGRPRRAHVLVLLDELVGADGHDEGLTQGGRVLDHAEVPEVEQVERAAGVDDWSLHVSATGSGVTGRPAAATLSVRYARTPGRSGTGPATARSTPG